MRCGDEGLAQECRPVIDGDGAADMQGIIGILFDVADGLVLGWIARCLEGGDDAVLAEPIVEGDADAFAFFSD